MQLMKKTCFSQESSGVSLTSWGEGAFLILAGRPSIDGITTKIPYRVDDLLHRPLFYYY